IAIVSALDSLATGNVDKADPSRYDSLPKNESKELYLLVKNATVLPGTGVPAFTGDIGVNVARRVQTIDGRRQMHLQATINDIGDLRTDGALRTIDATGLFVAPLWDPSLQEGQQVDLPDWTTQPSARILMPGQPGDLVIMRPLGDPSRPASRYIIQSVI